MKRQWFLVLAALPILVGCGARNKEKVVIHTPEGTVTSTTRGSDDGTTTVKGPNGEATVTKEGDQTTAVIKDAEGNITNIKSGKAVDFAEAGIKQYPGSTVVNGDSIGKVEMPQGTTWAMALETSDSPGEVVDWYAKELKSPITTKAPEGGSVMGTNAAGAQSIVMVSKEDGKTKIGISVTKQK